MIPQKLWVSVGTLTCNVGTLRFSPSDHIEKLDVQIYHTGIRFRGYSKYFYLNDVLHSRSNVVFSRQRTQLFIGNDIIFG